MREEAFRDEALHVTREHADLYVEVAGAPGGEPVYYLHGGPGYSSFSFRDIYGDSLEQHLLIYADQRGGGRSYADAPFGLGVLADDVRAVLQALGIGRTTLLAHGFGAAVAVAAAAATPELFRRLVLVNPWFSMPVLARTVQRTAAQLSGHPERALPPEAELGPDEGGDPRELTDEAFSWIAAKRVFDYLLFPEPSARLQLEHSDSNALMGPTEFAELEDPWLVDVRPQLATLGVPLIIIAGQHDRSCLPEQVETGLVQVPEALFSLTAGGHYPWLDDPDTFASLLEQALAS